MRVSIRSGKVQGCRSCCANTARSFRPVCIVFARKSAEIVYESAAESCRDPSAIIGANGPYRRGENGTYLAALASAPASMSICTTTSFPELAAMWIGSTPLRTLLTGCPCMRAYLTKP